MNRGTGLIFAFIGAMLIYLSVFGLTGVGFTFTLTSGFSDNFDDNNLNSALWSSFATEHATVKERNRRLEFTQYDLSWGWYAGVRTVNQYDFSDAEVSVDVGLADGDGVVVLHIGMDSGYMPPSNAYRIQWDTKNNRIWVVRWLNNDQTNLVQKYGIRPYGLKIKCSAGRIAFSYKTESGSWVSVYTEEFQLPAKTCYVFVAGHAIKYGAYGTQYVDNFILQTAAAPPSLGTGRLVVQTFVDGERKPPDYNRITVNGEPYYTDANGYWSRDVPPGVYTVSATYQGEPKSDTKTVYEGQTTTIQLIWGTEQPLPSPPDFTEWIKQFFQNPTVRSLMLIGGVGLVGVGFIMFITGGKKGPPRTVY